MNETGDAAQRADGAAAGGGGAQPRRNFCHMCFSWLDAREVSSDGDELKCARCGQSGFVEEFRDDELSAELEEALSANSANNNDARRQAGGDGGNNIMLTALRAAAAAGGGGEEQPSSLWTFTTNSGGGGGGGGGGSEVPGNADNDSSSSTGPDAQTGAFLRGTANQMFMLGRSMRGAMPTNEAAHFPNDFFVSLGGGGGDGGGEMAGVPFTEAVGQAIRRLLPMNAAGGEIMFSENWLNNTIQMFLQDDPNEYGNPPASRTAVDALPLVRMDKALLERHGECAVCKEDFSIGQEVMLMPCEHVFCVECLKMWLQRHNSCPTCRYEMMTDDEDYERRRAAAQATMDSARHNGAAAAAAAEAAAAATRGGAGTEQLNDRQT